MLYRPKFEEGIKEEPLHLAQSIPDALSELRTLQGEERYTKNVTVMLHYFVWPNTVLLNEFDIRNLSSWHSNLESLDKQSFEFVKEQIQRTLSALILAVEITKKGYTVDFIHSAADVVWAYGEIPGQLYPSDVVRILISQISEIYPELKEELNAHHIDLNIDGNSSKTSIDEWNPVVDNLRPNTTRVFSVTTLYHADRVLASISDGNINKLRKSGIYTITSLGTPLLQEEGEKVPNYKQFVGEGDDMQINLPAEVSEILKASAITPSLMRDFKDDIKGLVTKVSPVLIGKLARVRDLDPESGGAQLANEQRKFVRRKYGHPTVVEES
ncbi:MAG: hypothetical protein ABI721_01160 [Candidatus Dojkabacteria bacterium]